MFIKLVWKRKSDRFIRGMVIGDPKSIQDLYWQLTHNYKPVDGTEIGEILVSDLDGNLLSNLFGDPFEFTSGGVNLG